MRILAGSGCLGPVRGPTNHRELRLVLFPRRCSCEQLEHFKFMLRLNLTREAGQRLALYQAESATTLSTGWKAEHLSD
jgi:hypothetical protein